MPLDCSYNSLVQGTLQCIKTIGGVRKSYGADWQDIATCTVVDGIITFIALAGAAEFAVLVYDDDNTASYNQEGVRNGLDYRVNQTATLKFTGATKEKVVKANKAKGIHKGFWLHLQNDGTIHSQGVELNADGDEGVASTVGAKVNPNVNSNTGEGSSDVTYIISATSSDLLPCSMTEAALDALSDIS